MHHNAYLLRLVRLYSLLAQIKSLRWFLGRRNAKGQERTKEIFRALNEL